MDSTIKALLEEVNKEPNQKTSLFCESSTFEVRDVEIEDKHFPDSIIGPWGASTQEAISFRISYLAYKQDFIDHGLEFVSKTRDILDKYNLIELTSEKVNSPLIVEDSVQTTCRLVRNVSMARLFYGKNITLKVFGFLTLYIKGE